MGWDSDHDFDDAWGDSAESFSDFADDGWGGAPGFWESDGDGGDSPNPLQAYHDGWNDREDALDAGSGFGYDDGDGGGGDDPWGAPYGPDGPADHEDVHALSQEWMDGNREDWGEPLYVPDAFPEAFDMDEIWPPSGDGSAPDSFTSQDADDDGPNDRDEDKEDRENLGGTGGLFG